MPVEPALIGADGADQERDPDGCDGDLGIAHAANRSDRPLDGSRRERIQRSEDMRMHANHHRRDVPDR